MSEFHGAEDVVWDFVDRGGRCMKHTGNGPCDVEEVSAEREKPAYNQRLKSSGEEITKIVVEKNLAYGDAINKVYAMMLVLFPKGIKPKQYMDMLLLVRDLDKTCRIADGDPDAFDESPWKDKAGYGICGMAVHDG